jgi:hypothetical protein
VKGSGGIAVALLGLLVLTQVFRGRGLQRLGVI